MNCPKLSVIVPVFNLEKYIEECLSGIVRQKTNFTYEVIVSDDGSNDSSVAVIEKLKKQHPDILNTFYHKNNRGLIENLRFLLSKVRGEYIAYIDGDDIVLNDKFQVQSDYLDKNHSCAVCYHESKVFNSGTGEAVGYYTKDHYNYSLIPNRAEIKHLVKYGTFLQASSVMFRNHGNLDKVISPFCPITPDFPMHMYNAFYGNGTIDFIDQTLGKYRIHDNSLSAITSRSTARRESVLSCLIKSCENSRELGVSKKDINQGINHFQFAAALYFLRMGEYELFNKYICLSAENDWFFNEKHKTAFNSRSRPELLRERFFE